MVPCGSTSAAAQEAAIPCDVSLQFTWFLCGSMWFLQRQALLPPSRSHASPVVPVWFRVVPSAPQRRKPPFLAMLPCSSRGSCVVPCGSYGGNRFCRQAVLMEVPWFAPPKASQKIIPKIGKRLASQFPNLVIILGAGYPQEQSDLGAKLFMCGSGRRPLLKF